MDERHLHSCILACDFRVDDVARMWSWLGGHHDALASIGAHHVVLYRSIAEPGRVLVTMGIRHAASIREVLGSPAFFEWFDISGARDIPPVFGGEVVEKIDLRGPGDEAGAEPVVVGVMSSVDDVDALMAGVHNGVDRFRSEGLRKLWVYRALDDGREVLILQELADAGTARRWLDHPDAAARWMAHPGAGAYPTHFVGTFAELLTVSGQG
jgi:hypothetical protein